MPTSTANVNPVNLELSPMRVTYKGRDLGATLGTVKVAIETMKADMLADQLGKTVIDRKVSGHKFTVETELAEVRFKDNWQVVFPNFFEATSGPDKLIFANSQVGRADSDDSGHLLLHPLSKADADLSLDLNYFKAIADAKSELIYGPEQQTRMKILWNILPDFTTTPARFMTYGDPSVGLISAMAGSPGFTGTGNGTMTGVSVFNGFTKTETITAQLVTVQSNAGVFFVSGSISGPLGLATVGVGFSCPVIAFTINDGSIDFALGDTFTVATTAANYV